MKPIRNVCVLLALGLFLATGAFSQTVFKHSDSGVSLDQRIDWAHDQARSDRNDSYWVAYSIDRQMKEDSWMGHFSSDWKDEPTLAEVLTGRVPEENSTLRDAAKRALDRSNKKHSDRLVQKEVVILQLFHRGVLTEINQSNIELAYNFEGHDIYWLAEASDGESIPFLVDAYANASDTDLEEDLVTAVAVHDDRERTRPFVYGVLESNAHNDVREGAVFWMSRYESAETVRYLHGLAENDRSEDVRENAVFALSRMKTNGALDRLIGLAQRANDEDVREKARFWLGQRASKELLGDVDEGDEESKLQKQAVFALAQLDDDEGVDELIDLAHHHSNPVVRKQAIFWLGQAESDRALDAIIEMLKAGS